MDKTDKCYKAFNFDLVISQLKKHYPDGHYTKAYKDIQSFFKKNGFEHRQGSGYLSLKMLSDVDVMRIGSKLNKSLPWLGQCVNKFDVTDIGEMHDLTHIFVKTSKPQRQKPRESLFKKVQDIENNQAKENKSPPLLPNKER